MVNKFQSNFNSITNILILFVLVFGGFVWADTNGVWHRAEDIIPGIFGDDEIVGDFIFGNDVIFNGRLKEGLIYEIDINGTTKLNDLRSSEFNTNLANINGDLTVDNSLILEGITCGVNEKLTSDASGVVSCVLDDVGIDTNANTECSGTYSYLNGDGTCRDVRSDGDLYDTTIADTNAGTKCSGANQFLAGDGSCKTGYLDSDGVDNAGSPSKYVVGICTYRLEFYDDGSSSSHIGKCSVAGVGVSCSSGCSLNSGYSGVGSSRIMFAYSN